MAAFRRSLEDARRKAFRRERARRACPRKRPLWPSSRLTRWPSSRRRLSTTASIPLGAPGERYQVVVHVDAAVLADADQAGQSVLEDGLRVPAGTSQRLACDASRVVMRHAPDGRVVEVGARTRTIPPALRRALHHRDRISPCCVAGTTAPCTRRATGWSDKRTASYTSGVRTGGACPRCRLPPRRPPIPSRPSGGCTRHGGSASTRGPRPRGGWGSTWTWAGRSTSCTRWRGSERAAGGLNAEEIQLHHG